MTALTIILTIIVGILFLGFLRTVMLEYSADQKIFLAGTAVQPKGLYAGIYNGVANSWKGKEFTGDTGINHFDQDGKDVTLYPFRNYISKGVRMTGDTIKIDYNIAGNPLWLRPILDEAVLVGKNEYLGKLQLRIIPGFPFTILFFRLQKS